MGRTAFFSQAFPGHLRRQVHRRLRSAHDQQPFSAIDPRDTVRRVGEITSDLGLHAVVCRGVVDLGGAEIDHVWLDVEGRVLDASLPLREAAFVDLLRHYVAGDLEPEQLADVAARMAVDARVLGEFPAPIRYLGHPVWASRQ